MEPRTVRLPPHGSRSDGDTHEFNKNGDPPHTPSFSDARAGTLRASENRQKYIIKYQCRSRSAYSCAVYGRHPTEDMRRRYARSHLRVEDVCVREVVVPGCGSVEHQPRDVLHSRLIDSWNNQTDGDARWAVQSPC